MFLVSHNSFIVAVLAGISVASAILPTSPYSGQTILTRPDIQPFPFDTGYARRTFAPRNPDKTCFVPPSKNGSDSSPAILAAFNACNNGGTIVLDSNYTIASPLNLTFLDSVDVALSGTVNFKADINYWTGGGAYTITYQNSSTFWVIGGTDVNIYGGGVGILNGNGEAWWNASLTNDTLMRPILFVADGLKGATISGLHYVNPPNVKLSTVLDCFFVRKILTSSQWFNLIANSTDVVVSNLNLSAVWSTGKETPNSDGWDIYKSDAVVLQDSTINNGDDCVSFKPNSTNVVVQNLVCNGSHGISVGSLGQYANEYDIAENLTIYNISLSNAGDGARIKVWPGVESSEGALLDGGGGAGHVKNVTYQILRNENNNWAIEINQCYGQSNTTLCELYPVSPDDEPWEAIRFHAQRHQANEDGWETVQDDNLGSLL